ncbi:DUF4132 domain-containing protein [Actinomadura sp. WAC 06369]|uniref:DUF4132 domain-containing protein n=1 Tax=Actinomadura sp. WAC 06369 TaxID=2203193 RepID=UPI000F7AF897|nr:DUF4132 domain-containing protein [Actinomadura sp. WAC 06369]RSN53922.1 hypothetical protein DMH08_27345 [Actinomadura sp. WAC 06369]
MSGRPDKRPGALPDALPDEDVLTLPSAWLRLLHPRRGGTPVPRPRGGYAADVPDLLAAAAPHVEGLPRNARSAPDVRDAARRHLAGEPDALGAAAVAAVAAAATAGQDLAGAHAAHRAFADRWHAGHGLGFAACAAVELTRLTVTRDASGFAVERHTGVWPEEGATGPLRHVRRLLATAPAADHDDAVRLLADRRTTPAAAGVAAYLAPTRRDWVAECVEESAATPWLRRLARLSVADPAPLGRSSLVPYGHVHARDELVTLADGVGPDLLGILLDRLELGGLTARDRGFLLDTVAVLPSDEAFGALLGLLVRKGVRRQVRRDARRALGAAAARFPVRALRLAAASGGADVRLLLRDHVAANPELVAAVLPDLPGDVRAVVEPLAAGGGPALPEAPPDVLPAPPWDRPVKPVVRGAAPPATRGTAWDDGERAAWFAEAARRVPPPDAPDWERIVRSYRRGDVQWQVLLHAPEEFTGPLLADLERNPRWCDPAVARGIVARLGERAYRAALALVGYSVADHVGLLVPFRDAEVAAQMAGRLLRGGPAGEAARDWCDRHGPAAAPYLAPDALGTRTGARRAAEAALRRIAARHGTDAVAAAVPAAAEELRTLLTAHPAQTGLARRPKLDGWANLAALPPVLLRGGDRVLPAEAVRTLVELLALPDDGGAGAVEEVCDPGSLAEFGLALFERWRVGGMPSDGRWALEQLARTGDDAAVRAVLRALRGWTKRDVRDVTCALRTLAGIGSDTAVTALYEMSVKGRARKVRDAAAEVLAETAAARGLAVETLADRSVPRLGLDADAATTLDYGPRRFTVGFDERLAPVVADGDGARRATLPRPTAKDDPVLAPAAHARFADLRKEVEAVALLQVERLERAMLDGRRWTPGEFRGYAVAHPVVRRIARRLVWIAEEDGGHGDGGHGDGGATAFRVAEDGTFADAADEAFEPSGTARIRVAHPELLGAETETWTEIFADYEVLQPFAQLGRPCLRLTGRERDASVLGRFEGMRLLRRDVHDLPADGWTWNSAETIEKGVSRPVGGGLHVVVEFEPGPDAATLSVRCVRASAASVQDGAHADTPVRFRDLDPVRTSEALTALTALACTSA